MSRTTARFDDERQRQDTSITIREIDTSDREWVRLFLKQQFGSTKVVSRGVLHQADELPGFIGVYDGKANALLTYRVFNDELEVVSLHAAISGKGLGSRLLGAARKRACELRCCRLWLITTNDNEPAIEFYKRWGLRLADVHRGAIVESRKLKSEISFWASVAVRSKTRSSSSCCSRDRMDLDGAASHEQAGRRTLATWPSVARIDRSDQRPGCGAAVCAAVCRRDAR